MVDRKFVFKGVGHPSPPGRWLLDEPLSPTDNAYAAPAAILGVKKKFTAIIQQDGPLWIGWVIEVPGVNGQGDTHEELLDSLRSALREALEMNRQDAMAAAHQPFEQEVIEV